MSSHPKHMESAQEVPSPQGDSGTEINLPGQQKGLAWDGKCEQEGNGDPLYNKIGRKQGTGWCCTWPASGKQPRSAADTLCNIYGQSTSQVNVNMQTPYPSKVLHPYGTTASQQSLTAIQ